MAANETETEDGLAGIEYHGVAGSSADCEMAVLRLLMIGPRLARALILTADRAHALILFNEFDDPIAIKSGFASGYGGSGPTALSRVVQFLWKHDVDIEEVMVDDALIERLDRSGLTTADLAAIEGATPLRPSRWGNDYIRERENDAAFDRTLWGTLPHVMPFAILDPRLVDLAMVFDADSDACLHKGYRQLEDALRKRTGLKEFGGKLFSKAFQGEGAVLTWVVQDPAEAQGRANLFAAVFMAYRNPRAHRLSVGDHLSEFLLLNQLYKLEADAVVAAPAQASDKT
jgi:hypothetical protein